MVLAVVSSAPVSQTEGPATKAIGIPALLAALAVTTWSCGGHVADTSITRADTVRLTAPGVGTGKGVGNVASLKKDKLVINTAERAEALAVPLADVVTVRRLLKRREDVLCPHLGQSCPAATSRWAVAWAPSLDPWAVALKQAGNGGQERIPLPAYDDRGIPIDRAEIEARMRGAGTGRAAGGLVGGLVGGGLGFLLGSTICPVEILGPGCSPRDEAYAFVAFLSGLAWGVAVGAFIGGEISGTDRWEALEQIRAERRQILSGGRKK